MGLFITFEGPEGSGKTTQIKKAGEYLKKKKFSFVITEEPGGTALGRELRKLLLNSSSLNIARKTELLLFAAARSQHVDEVIIPAIREGKIVLCDRYSDATVAYQGFGRGLDINDVLMINDFASQFLKPDVTFFFDLPVDRGLSRALTRISRIVDAPAEDRFEKEDIAFHRRVREGYLERIKDEPDRFRVIDAAMDIPAVHREVCRYLDIILSE